MLGIAFDIRIRRGVVLAPVVILVVAGVLARALRRGSPRSSPPRPPRAGVLAARAAFGISSVIAAGLFAEALTAQNVGWDGEMTWCVAARWVRAERSVTPRVLVDPRTSVSHPRYPLLMPLAQVTVQEAFALADDRRAIKPLYTAFFPALLLVFFDIARRHSGTCAAAFAAAAFASIPILAFTNSGGADGTYSDVPLGAFFGGGVLLLLGRARLSEGVGAALLLGAGVLTKNEGLPFALAALSAAGFLAVVARPTERRRRCAVAAVAAAGVLAAAIALSAWRARIPQRFDEDYIGRLEKVSLPAEVRSRLPMMPAALMEEMTNREYLAGFGLACAVIFSAGAGGLRRRIVLPILVALLLCFGAYLLAILLSPWGGVEQLHTTWDRLLIQLSLPLGVLLALALRSARRARFGVTQAAFPGDIALGRPVRRRENARSAKKGLLVLVGLAVVPVIAIWLWSSYLHQRAGRSASQVAWDARGIGTRSSWREDSSLTGSIDEPAEGSTVRGELGVRGWARIPGQDLRVVVLIDGKERSFSASARQERRDVERVIPSLGDCASAGYEFKYAFSSERDVVHEVQVVLRTDDGRERHYPARWFVWNP